MFCIREADKADFPAVTAIYNEAILTTTATFDTEPKCFEEREIWFEAHGSQYPMLVMELGGSVVGWASLSRFSDRCAYSKTAEISLYIKDGYRGQGIGRKLIEAIVLRGREAGLHTILSRITSGNEISIHLHEAAGFEHVGIMKEVGTKFGLLLDVCLMQLIYE